MLFVIGFGIMASGTQIAGLGMLIMWVGAAMALTGGFIKRAGLGFVGAFVGSLIAVMINPPPPGATAGRQAPIVVTDPNAVSVQDVARREAEAAARAQTRAPLILNSRRGYESYGFHIVEGQVTNTTDKPIESLMAVANWYGSDGTFITSDSALVEYNPLMPGQTSPFKTMSRTNPLMQRFTVEFKTMFGPTLEADEPEAPRKGSGKKR